MNLFSIKLYKECLRQSKAMGLCLVAVSIIISGMNPLIILFQNKDESADVMRIVSVGGVASMWGFFALIMPLVLIPKLFGFVYKRSSSDFYHAIPFTRQCYFVTNLLLALTWYVAALLSSFGITYLILLLDKHTIVKGSIIWVNILYYFLSLLLSTGAILVALSLAGKKSTSIETAVFVLFIPRLVFMIVLDLIARGSLVVDPSFVPLLSPKYSLVYVSTLGRISSEFFYGQNLGDFEFNRSFVELGGYLYTGLVGLILIGLGMLLFVKRKSEYAENALPNRKLERFIQQLYAIFFFVVAASALFDKEVDVTSAAFYGVVGVFIFFIYDYACFKKLGKVVRDLPFLLISIAFSVIFMLIANAYIDYTKENYPSADDIESVCFPTSSDDFLGDGYLHYEAIVRGNYYFKDAELNQSISDAFANSLKDDTYYDFYDGSIVKIRLKSGKEIIRSLVLDTKGEAAKEKAISQCEEYNKQLYEVPWGSKIYIFEDEADNEKLWNGFKAEYDAISEEDKGKVNGNSDYSGNSTVISSFGYEGLESYYKNYLLIEELMPESTSLYYALQYKRALDVFNKTKKAFEDKSATGVQFTYNFNFEYKNIVANNVEIIYSHQDNKAVYSIFWNDLTYIYSEEIASGGEASSNYQYYELSKEDAQLLFGTFYKMIDSDASYEETKDNSMLLNVCMTDTSGFYLDYAYESAKVKINSEAAEVFYNFFKNCLEDSE